MTTAITVSPVLYVVVFADNQMPSADWALTAITTLMVKRIARINAVIDFISNSGNRGAQASWRCTPLYLWAEMVYCQGVGPVAR